MTPPPAAGHVGANINEGANRCRPRTGRRLPAGAARRQDRRPGVDGEGAGRDHRDPGQLHRRRVAGGRRRRRRRGARPGDRRDHRRGGVLVGRRRRPGGGGGGRRPSRAGRPTTPGERATALWRLADRHGGARRTSSSRSRAATSASRSPRSRRRSSSTSTTCASSPAPPAPPRPRPAGEYMAGYTSILRREPLGVVASIAPWNYPLMMAIWKIGPALAAGNTVVLKPSELTPLTALRLAELAADLLPPGVLNVVTGQGESAGAALVGPSRGRDRLAHRRGHHRQGGHARRGRLAQARPPGAGRQGAGGGLRRRRPRGGRRRRAAVRLLQRRPGLHGLDARASPGRASTATSWTASPRRRRAS